MNKKAQGTTLMHLVGASLLVVIIVLFILAFNLIKLEVDSSSLANGDFFAENALRDIIEDKFVEIEGNSMLWQEALNNDDLRPKAIDLLETEVLKKVDEMQIRNHKTLISKVKGDRSVVVKVERSWPSVEASGSRLDTFSVACWPMIDRGELAYLKVYIGDSEHPADEQVKRGIGC